MPGYCKYYKEKRQISRDGGITWSDTGEVRTGEIYETNSRDCGYSVVERWVTTAYTCVGYDKYNVQAKEISEDGGNTWTRTTDTRQTLNQKNSLDCGYGAKLEATLTNSTIQKVSCDQAIIAESNRLTWADTSGFVGSITSAIVRDCAEIIDDDAFSGASAMTSVTVANSVYQTGRRAFAGCTSLSAITLPNVSSVGQASFSGCTALTSITLPAATTIGVGCFMSCTSLQEIELPSTVSSIGMYAFDFCSSLKKVKLNSSTPPTIEHDILLNTPNDLKIYVPCNAVEAYKTANIWSNYADKIICEDTPQIQYRWVDISFWCDGANLKALQKKQVSNDYGVTWTDVTPQETQEIVKEYLSDTCGGTSDFKLITRGKYAGNVTQRCMGTTELGQVTSGDVLGNESQIYNVTGVTLGRCANEIMTNAFNGSYIEELVVPSGVTELHNTTLAYCNKLKTVEFQRNTPPEFGTGTFSHSSALEKIIVPQGSLSAYQAVSNLSQWRNKMEEKQ